MWLRFIFNGCFVNVQGVLMALCKLISGKNDGDLGLASDYFLHDLSVHIALLFTSIISPGFMLSSLLYSTIISVPKRSGFNAIHSDKYCGIALSSVFGRILDNVNLVKCGDKQSTCNLHFGFKRNSSTVYTCVHDGSYASKAFDRVHYCKLFSITAV